jgi:biopolymer transport protein ExbB
VEPLTPDQATAAFGISRISLILIVGGSTLVVALALEQLYTFWGLVQGARDLGTEVGKLLMHGDLQAARTVCERSNSPVADIFIAALNKVNRPGHSVPRAVERERQRFSLWMKRRLWALGTVGALAPFVGLFGTVVGIIRAFRDIGLAGTGGFSVVAEGVAEALYATAGGIFVAVVAVGFFNYFQSRGNKATVEVKLVIDEFLEQLESRPADGSGALPDASGAAAPAEA